MCGLAGWTGSNNVSQRQSLVRGNVLTALLLANAERGTDAAGIATISPDGVSILKAKGSSYDLASRGDFREAVHAPGLRGTIGHTRLATHGKNKDRNAHPFRERSIVGAHNGVIWNHDDLSKRYSSGIPKPALVDSQAVFRLLSTASGGDLLGQYAALLPKADGDLALTWQDSRDPEAVYIFRHGNPLSLAVAPVGKAAFWSSEMAPLAAAMEMAYKDWYPVAVEEDVLYRFWWDDKKSTLMYTRLDVDMPDHWLPYKQSDSQWKSLAVKYGSTNLLSGGETDDEIAARWLGNETGVWCAICDLDCEDFVSGEAEDGFDLCRLCDRWWREFGHDKYASIEEAQAIHETAGIGPGGRQ